MAQEKVLYPSDYEVFSRIQEELDRARSEFPESGNQLAALQEEVGELSKALLDHKLGDGAPADIIREAVQTATMAVRVATEGDTTFEYDNPEDPEPVPGANRFGPQEVKDAVRILEALEGALVSNRGLTRFELSFHPKPNGQDEIEIHEKHKHKQPCPIGSGSDIFLALSASHTYFRQKGHL